ncbi:MAG: molybdate ABC transporter substrate-binding protein [Vicinamibacterales bacterium]
MYKGSIPDAHVRIPDTSSNKNSKGDKLMREVLSGCAAFVWLILLPALAFAQTEIRVFVGGAVTEPVKEAGAAFTRASGNTFVYVSDTTGALQKRLAAGEKADLVIVAGPGMDGLQKANLVVAGSRVDLARALIGVAVRAGASSPDLSTPDTVKAALLKARSVSYVNPASGGTSGTYFEGLLQKMGIADAMKSKIVYRTQGSEVADAVAKGEAELGISFTSELQPNKGVKVAGTLPAAIQLPTIYMGAIPTSATNADAARAFLRTLTGAEGRAALTKAGLEPVGPAR